MTEREYVPLIPTRELQEVEALLKDIYDGRGCAAQPLMLQASWQRVFDEATTLAVQPWTEDAPLSSFTPERLDALAELIDSVFLAGQLQGWLRAQGKEALQFHLVTQAPGPDDWYANFFPQRNAVGLRASRWADQAMVITTQRPVNYEGVHCTSRLQVRIPQYVNQTHWYPAATARLRVECKEAWSAVAPARKVAAQDMITHNVCPLSLSQVLLHTMAHEMVHVLVHRRLPDIDASSAAYTVDERHGPIFRLLNAKLFGHTTEDFTRTFYRR